MKKSFTLIELMIIISMLGVLSASLAGNFITSLKKGRDARRKADLEQIQRALEMYYEDKKKYPTFNIFASNNSSLCETRIASDCNPEKTYMQKIPNDPVAGKSYEYQSNGREYRLYACLENNQQILPYDSLSGSPTITCSTQCKKKSGGTMSCFWGVSSPNVNP